MIKKRVTAERAAWHFSQALAAVDRAVPSTETTKPEESHRTEGKHILFTGNRVARSLPPSDLD